MHLRHTGPYLLYLLAFRLTFAMVVYAIKRLTANQNNPPTHPPARLTNQAPPRWPRLSQVINGARAENDTANNIAPGFWLGSNNEGADVTGLTSLCAGVQTAPRVTTERGVARGRAGGGTCAHRAGQMAMAGSRKGAGSKGGAELPRGRVVQPAPLKVMQPAPLKGDPYFPQPVPGESQRRFEAFTVRGRPFIATTRGSESSKPTPRSTKAATRGGAPSAINVSPRYLQGEQSTRGVPRSPHSARSPCSPLAPPSPHTPGAPTEFSSGLLRLWHEDEEWRSEAIFRSILVKDSFKPGARTLEAQRGLGETEDKLLRTVRRFYYAKLLRRFRLWHRRAAVLKLLALLSRPLMRGAMTDWRAIPLRRLRALNHLKSRRLSSGWNAWATMATEWREAVELMRRSLSCLVRRKLTMGFQSWLGANAADAVAQGQRDTAKSLLLHWLHRELSRGWAGWQAQWRESLRKRESARRGMSLLVSRRLSGGWNAWATMATEGREAVELMRRSLSCLVNRKLTMGFQSAPPSPCFRPRGWPWRQRRAATRRLA